MIKMLFNIKTAASVIFFLTAYSTRAQETTPVKPDPYAAYNKINYVRTWEAMAPETNPSNLISRPLNDVRQTTQYFDGLSRPLQTVVKGGSFSSTPNSSPSDMVSAVVYDEYGREIRKYLPFQSTDYTGNFKLNPFDQQKAFYDVQLAGQSETFYYGKTIIEKSHLSRIEKNLPPGNSWVAADRGVAVKYFNNTVIDEVKKWSVSSTSQGTFSNYFS
jgi:hypothetical protein